ncbi:putative Ig domain-containing protein [Curtobacterium sp. MCBA15_008]|uniref:putative Ig domain-containing protein n=1 Tax=Curtobacterium sp. MCBA15_008 TaxID=1898736 RepID=UPI0008DD7A56|nr:putative Ig domain-containing protein [Curtobacterium sp. MCBA15_008]OII10350.1 hypothetical protein BIU96_18235 [Curtobacterium sp. MCBA15_008]
MRRSTSAARRACAVGTTIALIGLTTGLGIMTATSASAAETEPSVSAPSVSAPATAGDTSADNTPADNTPDGTAPTGGSESTGPAADSGSGSSDTSGSGDTGSTTPGDSSTGTPGTGTPGDGSTATGPVTPPSTTPATTPAAPDDQPTKSVRASAVQTATIEGDLTVGSLLQAADEGFTSDSLDYVWTDEAGTTLSKRQTYTIAPALAGQRITVTVTSDVPDEKATAVTETAIAPVFVDEDGQPISDDDSDAYIETKAGEAFSTTFRALSTPAPALSITWSDDDGEETTKAPAGVAFDPKTGVLSGTLTDALEYYDFTVTATTTTPSGVVSTDQYGEILVEAGDPVGIEVLSIDKDGLEAGTTTSAWVIHPNGDVYTEDLRGDTEPVKGGQVTVQQGGTLAVGATKVDRFGNPTFPDFNEETGEPIFFTPTVTSDVATDVIAADPDLGEVGYVSVTFPHASTHTLTVSGASLPSTSFTVDVRPNAVPAVVPAQPVVPAAVTTHHVGSGRLAYTGTDSTSALPWALGLVLAGIGLIGARTLRRRHAQR